MERLVRLRSVYRSAFTRSCRLAPASAAVSDPQPRHGLLSSSTASLRFLHHLSPSPLAPSSQLHLSDCRTNFASRIGSTRSLSETVSHFPDIKDPQILNAFKGLMACSWDDLPVAVVYDAKKALSKNTDDKAGQEALANVLRAAEACEEFAGILVTLRMKTDDCLGLIGEDVKPMPAEFRDAFRTVFSRYTAYSDSFSPEENYLRKKVETELGAKMILIKMRCAGLGPEWGETTVLGTSGLAGSYVEHRAR